MDNILINFTADPAGLQPGIDGMAQLEQADKELLAAINATTKAEQARNKATSDSAKAGKKDVEGLKTAFDNLNKINLGAAFKKTFDEIKSTLSLTDKQLKVFYQNIKNNAQAEIVKGGTVAELHTLEELIVSADAAIKHLTDTEEKASAKSQSLRTQLRLVKEELSQMETAGLEGSSAFETLQIKAGQLADQMGDTQQRISVLASDTFIFDAIASGVTGIAGAFSAAQGAAALFGDENEDLQKALLKVNAAMAVLQGVQAVVNVLQKQSAASIAVDLLLRRSQAAATTAVAVAETELAVATEGTTIATGALNAVMAINPAVLLITAIAALAGAVYYFSNSEEDATEKTLAFNDALSEQLGINKKLSDSFKDQIAEGTRALENELAYAEKSGKGAVELGKIRQKIATQRALIAQEGATANADELNNLEKYRTTYENTLLEISTLNEQIKTNPDSKKEVDEQIKIKQQVANINKEKYDQIKAIADEYHDSIRDLNGENLSNEKLTYEQSVKSAVAAVDARLAAVKRGSKEERDLQIEAVRARVKAETDSKLNPDLTPGERAKIFAEGQRQIADIHFEYQKKALIDAKAGIDAELELAVNGSKQELDLKVQSLEAARVIELKNQLITDNQRRAINAKFYKDTQAISKAFYKKVSEDALNQDIAETNTKISALQIQGANETNDQLLALKKKLIHDQSELEIVGIRASEDNENLKAARIAAVFAKELDQKRQLELDKAAAEIRSNASAKINAIQDEINANNQILNSSSATSEQKRVAREKNADELKKLARQESIEADALAAKGAAFFAEAEALKTKSAEDAANARVEIANVEEERKQIMIRQGEDIIQNSIQAVVTSLKARYEGEIDEAKNLYDQKLISEEEYNNRVRIAKRQEALLDREKALFDIAVGTAKNIIDVYPNPALIAFAAALGASQAALVLAQPLPAYKHGMIDIDGPGTATSDSILARISKGESVINADSTGRHKAALEAINENTFDQYLKNVEMPRMHHIYDMPTVPRGMEDQVHSLRSQGIDYDRLASVVAEKLAHELALNPHVNIGLDENGFTKSITKGLNTVEFKNKKINL